MGGGDENLTRMVGADQLEIDEALDQLLERIDVERIEIVGRPQLRQCAEPWRRGRPRHQRKEPLDGGARQARQVAVEACGPPELGKPLARGRRPAAGEPVGQHHRVEGAGRGAGNTGDLEPLIGQQLVDHAPGEGAVGAAPLQREIDPLAPRSGEPPDGCGAPEPPMRPKGRDSLVH